MSSQLSLSEQTNSKIAFFKPFDSFYINPTTRIYHVLLEAMPSVSTVGLDNHHEFSPVTLSANLVIFTPFVFLGRDKTSFQRMVAYLRGNYHIPFTSKVTFEQCETYYQKFLAFLDRSRASVLLLCEYDLHALTSDDFVLSCSRREVDYFLIAGPELFDLELHQGNFQDGVASAADLDVNRVQLGYDFLEEKKHRLVSLPHVMAVEEFCPETSIVHAERGRRIGVPGASYLARRRAVSEVIRRFPREYAAHLLDQGVLRLAGKIPHARLRQECLRSYFRHSIASSRISFTCGSTSGFFVRKFLEIPAFGACLCTFDYKCLENAGFKPDVHYLPVETVEDISAYVDRLNGKDFLQHVVDCTANGWSLVLKTHSAYARYSQLAETFGRIVAGNFRGSYWEGGRYSYS